MIMLKEATISKEHGWLWRWVGSIIIANMPQHAISSLIWIVCQHSSVLCYTLITHNHCRHVTNACCTDTECAETLLSFFQKLWQECVACLCLFCSRCSSLVSMFFSFQCFLIMDKLGNHNLYKILNQYSSPNVCFLQQWNRLGCTEADDIDCLFHGWGLGSTKEVQLMMRQPFRQHQQ